MRNTLGVRLCSLAAFASLLIAELTERKMADSASTTPMREDKALCHRDTSGMVGWVRISRAEFEF